MMFHYLVLLHYSMVCFFFKRSSLVRQAPDWTAPLLGVVRGAIIQPTVG
jgi:hypothetical protein